MAYVIPSVDLSAFPIIAKHVRQPGEEGYGDHTVKSRILCQAVGKALGLPPGVALGDCNYASLSCCVVDGEVAEYRVRVLGIVPGKNAKKKFEYLGLSLVQLDAKQNVIGWSEDIQADSHGAAYWAAVHAKQPLPPEKKGKLADCARLTFVEAANWEVNDAKPIAISDQIRAVVAKAVPAAASTKPQKPATAKPAAKPATKPTTAKTVKPARVKTAKPRKGTKR